MKDVEIRVKDEGNGRAFASVGTENGKRVITINTNAAVAAAHESFTKTLGHEIAHVAAKHMGWDALKEICLNGTVFNNFLYGYENIQRANAGLNPLANLGEMRANVRARYADVMLEEKQAAEARGEVFDEQAYVDEEIVADVLGATIFSQNKEVLEDFHDAEPGLFKRVLAWLKSFFKSTEGLSVQDDARKAIELFNSILKEGKVEEVEDTGREATEEKGNRKEEKESAGTEAEAVEELKKEAVDANKKIRGAVALGVFRAFYAPGKSNADYSNNAVSRVADKISSLGLSDRERYLFAIEFANRARKVTFAHPAGMLTDDYESKLDEVYEPIVDALVAEHRAKVGTEATGETIETNETGETGENDAGTESAGTESLDVDFDGKPLKPNEFRTNTPNPDGAITIIGEYRIVEADEVLYGDTKSGEQTRNREEGRTDTQILKINKDFQPERLFESSTTAEGATLVREDGGKLRSVSGEGRLRTLQYGLSEENKAKYRERLAKFAKQKGIAFPQGMKNPILVRVGKKTSLNGEAKEWVKVGEFSNRMATLTESTGELAASDAAKIDAAMLGLLPANATADDILALENSDFLNAFAEAINAGASVRTENGRDFTEDFGERVRNALLGRIVGNRTATLNLFNKHRSQLRGVMEQLKTYSLDLLRLTGDFNINTEISRALSVVLVARANGAIGPNFVKGVIAEIEQNDAFKGEARTGVDTAAVQFIALAMEKSNKPPRFEKFLKNYLKAAQAEKKKFDARVEAESGLDFGFGDDLHDVEIGTRGQIAAQAYVDSLTATQYKDFQRWLVGTKNKFDVPAQKVTGTDTESHIVEKFSLARTAKEAFSERLGLDKFFKRDERAIEIPLEKLYLCKTEPAKSLANARKLMELSAAGKGEARAPISVAEREDGTYVVVDGNATTSVLAQMGVPAARAIVIGKDTGTRLGNSALRVENKLDDDLRYNGKAFARLPEGATIDDAYALAEANVDALRAMTQAAADKVGGKMEARPKLKSRERASEKCENDYDGNWSRVVDLDGTTIIMPSNSDFADAIKALKKNLPEGASIAAVKKLGFGEGQKGYQDIKVSVLFKNGGVSEVILVDEHMFDGKMKRGGHEVYEAERILDQYEKTSPNKRIDEAYLAVKDLTLAIYAREAAADFESIKSNATSSLQRLLSDNMATSCISEEDIKSLKSLSELFHLAHPPSTDSHATPNFSLIKNAITPSNVAENGEKVERFSRSRGEGEGFTNVEHEGGKLLAEMIRAHNECYRDPANVKLMKIRGNLGQFYLAFPRGN